MARVVYNCFVRVFMYALPLWLGAFELTVHQAMKENDPEAFVAPGLMLSAIALLIPLCLAQRKPQGLTPGFHKLKYSCDIALIAAAAVLAVSGMPLWHHLLGASLTGVVDGLPALTLLNWGPSKSVAMLYYFIAVGLTELKRLII
jgi:hypothetical protein